MNNSKNNNGSSLFWTAIGGMVVGALAVLLSDEKRRERIRDKVEDFKKEGEELGERVRDKVEEGKKIVRKKLK